MNYNTEEKKFIQTIEDPHNPLKFHQNFPLQEKTMYLLRKMLDRDPNIRWSAKKCLQ